MPPSRYSSLCLALLAAAPALAQVSSVEITTPQRAVLAGRTIQLRARGLDEFGGGVRGFTPVWRSLAPDVARVSAGGEVRGAGIGVAEIEAADSDSGAASRVTIKVQPFRVEVTPPDSDTRAGATLSLSARALDADLNPLPAPFVWSSDQPAIATVAANGAVSALAEGTVTIYARVDVSGILAGAAARVNVYRRPDYRLRRLISSDGAGSAETIASIRQTSFAGNDVFAALVTLSGGGQAVLLREGGQTRTLAASGQYLDSIGRFITRFNMVSANSRGDVAALVDLPSEWCDQAVVLFRKNQPSALASPVNCGIDFTSRSLADNGAVFFRLQDGGGHHLVVRTPEGALRPVIDSGSAIPVLNTLQSINSPVASGSGNGVAFQATSPNGTRGWFYWDGNSVRKLFVDGDVIGDRTFLSVDQPVSNGGEQFFARANGANFSALVKLDSVKGPSLVLVSPAGAANGVRFRFLHFVLDARGDRVLMDADTDNAGKDYASRLATVEQGRIDPLWTAGNGRWFALSGGAFSSTGVVASALYGADNLVSIRAINGGTITTLVAPGSSFSGRTAPSLAWDYVPFSETASAAVFKGAGDALVEASGGGLRTLLSAPSLPSADGFQLLGGVASNAAGDVLVTSGSASSSALALLRNGRAEVIARANGPIKTPAGSAISWFHTYNGRYLALNSRRQAAVHGSIGARQTLMFFDAGASVVQPVMGEGLPAPGGGVYQSLIQVAVDEVGRVGFLARMTDGATVLYLWENGQVRRLAGTGDAGPQGLPLRDLNNLQAIGSEFAAIVNFGPNSQVHEMRTYDGTSSRLLLSGGRTVAGGSVITAFYGNQFAVVPSGELAYIAWTSDGNGVFTRRKGGADFAVWKNTEPGPDSEWLLQPLRVSVSDSGDVFFTALVYLNGRETLALYQATPR